MPVTKTVEDRAYFMQRAREERDKAKTSEDNAVAIAHLQMAEAYDKRAEKLDSVQPIAS